MRATHCRLSSSHATPGACLGATRSPEPPVPTSLQVQRPCLPPSRSLHPPGVPQAVSGPLPHRSQLAALPPPLQTHPSPGRAAWSGGVGGVTRMRTRPFARTCVSAPGASEPSTHLCERCDSVRFPDAGSAPGSPARVPTSGLAATDYSCVCPAIGGSASWGAAHGPGARAPRCPRLPPTAWGSAAGAAAELALRAVPGACPQQLLCLRT